MIDKKIAHLYKLGNILTAIGGNPIMYSENSFPTYPKRVLNMDISLKKMDSETFVMLQRVGH